MIALGLSAIGRISEAYCQNAQTLEDYYRLLDASKLPVARGLRLNDDDGIRYTVIMSIVCQGNVGFEEIENRFDIDFNTYFAKELNTLVPLEKDGLLKLESDALQVTPLGWYFVRGIAMAFDSYLLNGKHHARFFRKSS